LREEEQDPVQQSFREALSAVLKARFPLLYVETWEEERALEEISAVAGNPEHVRTPREVHVWSRTAGLAHNGTVARNTQEPITALNLVMASDKPCIYVFRDLHVDLGHGNRPADPAVVRRLRDIATWARTSTVPVTVILVAPVLQIPVELEKNITVMDFKLPTERELEQLLEEMVASNASVSVDAGEEDMERLVKAAVGLTSSEAENAFARAMAFDGRLDAGDIEVIVEEKRQTIRKSGVLEFIPTGPTFDEVGGLDNLKRWLTKRNNAWLAAAADYGVRPPKGVLISGVPGCGKSLTAKCVASLWELPLLRMDVGRIFSGLVGSSEQNMRSALRTAESIAPSILWIDEIEKGFGGAEGSAGDSGTSQRVFGTFLTWMQEKKSPVFVIATANNIDRLPPEFLRKGRFDEIFFVDLPTTPERSRIWAVHLAEALTTAAGGQLSADEATLERLAALSEGFSGAEIEQAIVTALFDAYAERRPLTEADLATAVSTTVPLSVTQSEQILRIRQWADLRAVAATSSEFRPADSSTKEAPKPPAPEPEVTASRGGRVVDF
jgi:SpoVK/Ycf46/Vps4 family AAA+-type ATPase